MIRFNSEPIFYLTILQHWLGSATNRPYYIHSLTLFTHHRLNTFHDTNKASYRSCPCPSNQNNIKILVRSDVISFVHWIWYVHTNHIIFIVVWYSLEMNWIRYAWLATIASILLNYIRCMSLNYVLKIRLLSSV